ncbi:MAG TPA: antibiotic biosynthesis monooxygenase [Steroidobacteraceae bacterium]|jgi:heme-degrading monooxygenase HmoA
MISRQWRGLAQASQAEHYIEHLKAETFPALGGLEGFLDAAILRRNSERGVEFLIVTRWQSLASIERFAGADVELAVVPEKVRKMMIEYDSRARHYEVIA